MPGTDTVLDVVTGTVAVMTLLLAVATVWLGITTRLSVQEAAKAASAAQAEADATLTLVGEARTDRALAVQPFITAHHVGTTLPSGGEAAVNLPTLQIRNIGRGPALMMRVFQYHQGEVFWSEPLFSLALGDVRPHQPEDTRSALLVFALQGHRGSEAVEPTLVDRRETEVVVCCKDQLGNGLRFRIRSGDPPLIWPRGDRVPPWSKVFEEPFDWRPQPREGSPATYFAL